MSTYEKRHSERYLTPYTALYCSYNGVRAVKLKDLSATGAALVFKEPICAKVNDRSILHFYSRGVNKLISKLTCRVVRAFVYDGHYSIGVEFTDSQGIGEVIKYLKENQG